MIKVALVLTPVDFGGSEKVCSILLEAFRNSKVKYTPIVLVRPWEKENIFIHKMEELGYKYHEVPVAIRQRHEGKDYFRILRCIRMMYDIIKKEDFDIIHTNGYFADITCFFAAKVLKKKVVSTAHGFLWNDWKNRLYNLSDLFVMRFFDLIIAVSEKLNRDLLDSKISNNKIRIIQNAVVPLKQQTIEEEERTRAQFGLGSNDLVLGYIGRLSPEKNIDNIIRACHRLNTDGYPCKLLIAGRGPEEDRLKNIVEKLDAVRYIKFLGFISEIDPVVSVLDIFVIASKSEGTPMALLEAMSYGVSVVATRVGGIPKIIQHKTNGILVKPNSWEEIYSGIKTVADDKCLREKLKKQSHISIMKEYGIDRWKDIYLGLYNNLLVRPS